MTMSDPVLYPLPRGNAESLRQDAARTRVELRATLEELARRLDERAFARRYLHKSATRALPALVGFGTVAVVLATLGRRLPRAMIFLSAAAAGAGAAVAVGRRAKAPRPEALAAPQTTPSLEPVPSATGDLPETDARVPGDDVVDVLVAQHRRIERMFAHVIGAPGDRTDLFAALVQELNRHEKAEQEMVHPLLDEFGGGTQVAAARLGEEEHADRLIASMISRGVRDGSFQANLVELRDAVLAHATAEEHDEFPVLRAKVPHRRLQHVATEVQAAVRAG